MTARKRTAWIAAAACICAATLIPACTESRDKKRQSDLELQRLIALSLLNSRDVTGNCVQAETQAISCANAAGAGATYGATMASVYTVTFSASPQAASLCNELPNSPLYGSFSASAKICHFTCYKQYFASQIAQNRCASQFTAILTAYTNCLPAAWIVTCTDSTLYGCLNQCFRTGTVIP